MLCVLLICVILWEKVRTLAMRWHPSKSLGCIISHRTHRFNRAFLAHAFVHWKFFLSQSTQSSRSFLAHVSSPQNAFGIQRTQSVSAKIGCNVLWVLPPARALWNAMCSVHLCLSVRKRMFESSWRRLFSHRAHRVHGAFWRTFRAHRTPPAYREHRAFLLKLAVRFCEFCRP